LDTDGLMNRTANGILCDALRKLYTVGYARTNVIGSRTSLVVVTVRSSVH